MNQQQMPNHEWEDELIASGPSHETPDPAQNRRNEQQNALSRVFVCLTWLTAILAGVLAVSLVLLLASVILDYAMPDTVVWLNETSREAAINFMGVLYAGAAKVAAPAFAAFIAWQKWQGRQ